MSKVRNPKVTVSAPLVEGKPSNPYKKGTAKRDLFEWALEKKEFTREEFLAAHEAMRKAGRFESVMSIEVAGKAWWNEFYNKFEVFIDAK